MGGKGQAQRNVTQSANGSAQEVKLEHPFGAEHLLDGAAKEIKADHVAQYVQEIGVQKLEGDQLPAPAPLDALQAQGEQIVERFFAHGAFQNHLGDKAHDQADQQNSGHGPVLPLRRAHV
jgi:hypothetical protein